MKQKIVYFNTTDQQDLVLEEKMLRDEDKIELVMINNEPEDMLAEYAKDADGIVLIYSKVSAETIKKLDQCKVIANQAIGYDNVDLKAATEAGICVANSPEWCIKEVATHSIAMALACVRRLIPLNRNVLKGVWDYKDEKTYRLQGKKFGLLAFGGIPKAMVPMIKGLGMDVIAYSRSLTDETCEKYGITRAKSMEELLQESDILSIHTPLTSQTENLIDEEQLKLMKKTAFLINTARGKIVNEDALLKALQNKWIAGAALDVLADETGSENPLFEMENVIFTPHTAFYSEEALEEVRESALEQVLTVLRDGKYPQHLVNKEVIGKARFEKEVK